MGRKNRLILAAALIGLIVLIGQFGPGRGEKAPERVGYEPTFKEPRPKEDHDAAMLEIKSQRLAREQVTAKLKDPGSAQFRNQKGFCGEVNAKNSFGGYGGFTRFIAAGKDMVVMENDPILERGAFESAWREFCEG